MRTDLQNSDFPRPADLRQGAVLATIAYGIWIANYPDHTYDIWWDGPNYGRQNGQGTRGTVTFADAGIVAAFCDDASPRTPWGSGSEYGLDRLLAGMPDNLRLVAEQDTLQYLLDEWEEGHARPIITAAFWSAGDQLTAAEPWQDVLTHGAHLIAIELMGTEQAIAAWQEDMELAPAQVGLLRSLYDRKRYSPGTPLTLESREYDVLVSEGNEGIDESRELLAAVSIIVPGGS